MEFTTEDLVWAVLAMDTYHRGENAGILGSSSANGTKIGDASISDYRNLDDPALGSERIGFYAIQYSWDADGDGQNVKTVYAYRGTDRGFTDTSPTGDIRNGYVLAAGLPDAAQALAAGIS